MLILTGRDGDFWEDGSGDRLLASFCAPLIRSRRLAGCLAPLPVSVDGRRRLFAFLQSFRRGGGGPTMISIRANATTLAVLQECDLAGVDRVLIVQGDDDGAQARASVTRFRALTPEPGLTVHVWLDPAHAGHIHRSAATWRRACGSDIVVEVAAVTLDTRAPEPAAPIAGVASRPAGTFGDIACDWLRGTVTVTSQGTVIPCPHHPPQTGIPLGRKPSEILFAVASFPQTLGANPTCLGCARRIRFTTPEWMRSGVADVPVPATDASAAPAYVDHVHGRLDDLAADLRAEAIVAFVERARTAGAATR